MNLNVSQIAARFGCSCALIVRLNLVVHGYSHFCHPMHDCDGVLRVMSWWHCLSVGTYHLQVAHVFRTVGICLAFFTLQA